MKIEYIETGSENSPLLRLFDFEQREMRALHDACIALAEGLAEGRLAEFKVHEQPWVVCVDQCRLIFRRTEKNRGAKWGALTSDPYVVDYNAEGWGEVADKIDSLLDDSPGDFQWLSDEGDFNLLLSKSGRW